MKTVTGFLVGLLVFSFLLGKTQTQDAAKFARLETTIRAELETSGAPGVVVAVATNGKMIVERAYGISNTNTKAPLQFKAVFPLGSITKTFTAAALLKTCEQQNIPLTTTVGEIIKGLSPKLSNLTIHQLLSHSAGMIDYWPNTNECRENMFEYFLRAGDAALFEESGKVFSYSNNGYSLAGLVLSILNRTTYSKAVDNMLLKPLNMTSTTFEQGVATLGFFANGHTGKGSVVPLSIGTNPVLQPAGGLFSTAEDLAIFASCFMNDGKHDTVQVLNPGVIKKMSTGYMPVGVQHQYLTYPDSHYNYGLIGFTYNGINLLGHSGETGSVSTLLVMAPQYKTAIIILSNTGYYPFSKTLEEAIGLFLPVTKPSKMKAEAVKEDQNILGKYVAPSINGSKSDWIEIIREGEKFVLMFPNKKNFELTAIGQYHYRFINPDFKFPLEIRFFADQTGKYKYLNYFWRTRTKED